MAHTDPRAELRELVRAARAHVEVLRDSGVDEHVGSLAVAGATAAARSRAKEAPSVAVTPAPPPVVLAPERRIVEPAPEVLPAPPRVPVSSEQRRKQLDVLATEVEGCTRCPLHATRNRTAFGRGHPDAPIVFVGEGPGTQEDLEGSPFVGPAGQLLDRMIAAMGLGADDVYIMNVVKCRPSEAGNPQKDRKPEPDEMAACRPFFDRQLDLLEPKVMVALGGTAVQALTGATAGITRVRGTWRLYKGRIPLMPTFHPAYLLRSPEKKREVWEDLKQVLQRLGRELPKRG